MVKTTVYLDAVEYRRLKDLARRRGVRPALVIREAIAEYTRARNEGRRPRTLASVDFDVEDLSDRVDDYLGGLGAAGSEAPGEG